ncbi:hypothetical protein MLD38_034073 [Melastoma candidum]|uniref:Uncharacterized protein n=1 Tax=Melastoma candidum TaxID=119954 RepID=A0ACB9M9F1_9MYRT|nr:hypothetical protein MLD38_034073 [Melastoma candidum]
MVWEGLCKAKPYLAMVSLQLGYAGMHIITLVSLNHGMSHYVLAVYRHVVATLVISPFAILLERKVRTKLTFSIFLRIMLLGFLKPVLDQNLYYAGMKSTSATFAAAIINVLPAVTFVMALILRLEKVNVKEIRSLAKVLGTVVTVCGAMAMALFKGHALDIIKLRGMHCHHQIATKPASQDWVTGMLMLLASCCVWSGFIILQSFTLKKYPAELSLAALICFIGAIQGAALSLIVEHDRRAWMIGWDSRLLAVGVVCAGIALYVQGMVMKERGPVFVTAFSPLSMILTAALGWIVLCEKLQSGSIIGAIFIILGLYTVVWGKGGKSEECRGGSDTDAEKFAAVGLAVSSFVKQAEGGSIGYV